MPKKRLMQISSDANIPVFHCTNYVLVVVHTVRIQSFLLFQVCWIPQSQYVASPLELPPCLSRESTRCMLTHFYFGTVVVSDNSARTGCPRPCGERIYVARPRRDPDLLSGSSAAGVGGVFLYHRSSFYTVYEEYRLYDANAIVAGLGGSLGLFLGFSCLSAAGSVLDSCLRKCGIPP